MLNGSVPLPKSCQVSGELCSQLRRLGLVQIHPKFLFKCVTVANVYCSKYRYVLFVMAT